MKRAAFFAALTLLLCAAAPPPGGDKEKDSSLALSADFSALRTPQPKAPEGANGAERALHTIRKQLTGRDCYDPPNYMFFRQAVRTIGFIPAIFATADRILRDTRLGTMREKLDPEDPYIHEGPEAYKPSAKQ